MIALLDFIPLYCPSFGTPTRLDQADNYELEIFQVHKALNCTNCGAIYQLADKTNILSATTASRVIWWSILLGMMGRTS